MFDYPALYTAAGKRSDEAQKLYLRLIAAEYALLFVAAVMALDLSTDRRYFVFYAFVFLASLVMLIVRSWLKPEQQWYRARALTESIKTTCWRYCMCAEPFGRGDTDAITRTEFLDHLRSILKHNQQVDISPEAAAGDQITTTMETTRALTLAQRRAFYLDHRVREQRKWYAKKAVANKKASKWWLGVGVFAYAVAILLVLFRIAYPEGGVWPIEPIIVVASAIIGWTQVKKFNELTSSYALTSHEIGIIQSRIQEVKKEGEFAAFVNEAEQAFSREHTQWVARQQSQ